MAKNRVTTSTNALRALNAIALAFAVYRCIKCAKERTSVSTALLSVNFWLTSPVIDVVVLSMSEIGLLHKRSYYHLFNDEYSREEPVDQHQFAMAYNALNLGRCTAGFFTLPNLSPELTTSTALSTLNIAYHATRL